jgi:hypothetical protein
MNYRRRSDDSLRAFVVKVAVGVATGLGIAAITWLTTVSVSSATRLTLIEWTLRYRNLWLP